MIDIVVPAEQDGSQAIVRAWLRQVGETVGENDPLVELETDKVTQEVCAPGAGILAEILLDSDAEALPGAVLGRLREVAAGDAAPPPPGLSPAVRQAVRAHGIDVSSLDGSGRDGRITRADVDRAIARRTAIPPEGAAAPSGVRVIPHDRMRRAIAQNMVNSVATAPHVTSVFEADFSAIMAHRRGHALTVTAYLVAASARAMGRAPAINSRWHDDRLEIFDDIDIGVGVALGERGLIVPVLRRAQDLSLQDIAARLSDLTGRARTGALTAADVRGGTFTISNHGTSGSLLAAPIIINQPQSAILGVGRVVKRVVVREVDGVDTIQIRPMGYVSLTVDHRVVDAHQTNAWLSRFVETIEGWPP